MTGEARRPARPLVGVTVTYAEDPDLFSLRNDYVRSVELAGGLPVLLAPGSPSDAAEVLDHLDVLVLSGGSDVDPSFYGEPCHPALGRVLPERDVFELALAREALARDTPMLAICRGHQVLNVATGGTLVQDIPSEVAGALDHDLRRQERWAPAHDVTVAAGSRLAVLLGSETVAVNSFHHQSVKRLGRGLVVTARSADEVVEAVELPGARFVVGVQWHPESFWGRPQGFQPLFDAAVEAGRRR